MKILVIVLSVAACLFAGFVIVNVGGEFVWGVKRKHVVSQITASYLQRAARGEVPAPGTNSDALQCWSGCYWSLPCTLQVTLSSGAVLDYVAAAATNSNIPYTFRLRGGRNATGKAITNVPGI